MGGLASENVRWAEAVQNFKQQERKLCGDILLIAAFISYLGFFTKKYRQNLMDGTWRPYLSQLKVRTARISPAHLSPWVPVSSHDSNNPNLLVPSRILSPTTPEHPLMISGVQE